MIFISCFFRVLQDFFFSKSSNFTSIYLQSQLQKTVANLLVLCTIQIKDMVADKQEEVATLESRLSVLDKEYEWKKEVNTPGRGGW